MLLIPSHYIPLTKRKTTHLHLSTFLSSYLHLGAIEMPSNTYLSYRRLRTDGEVEEDGQERVFRRTKSWSRFTRFTSRKRPKVRIPGLRRFLRRKARLISNARLSWGRLVKRFKESGSHFGDLFAGNYLFMQVTPTSFKCVENTGHDLHGLPSRYNLGRIAYN